MTELVIPTSTTEGTEHSTNQGVLESSLPLNKSTLARIISTAAERAALEQVPAASSSPEELWQKVIDVLAETLDSQIFAAWIKPLSLISLEVNREARELVAELGARNSFSCEHVRRNYSELIGSALRAVSECDQVTVRVRPVDTAIITAAAAVTEESRSVSELRRARTPKPVRTVRQSDSSSLNPKYNFSNFVVGACNQFAHAVGLRVSEMPGANYNPLFIYGGVGLGKTHLVNAIGNASKRRGKNVLLVSSEIFVNELIAALRSNQMQQFKEKFRSLDVLIIDDIQFIIGKERTQEEFFHTFNALHQRHSQIIITSDKVPQELTGLEDRLRTRFASGLSADLQAPDFETRVAILMKKSESENIDLPQDVARLLAEKIDTNVRELEGALNRLHALSSLNRAPITVDLAESALRTIVPEKTRELTTEFIQKTVAEKYNTTLKDLLGKRRTQNIAFPRQVAMYLCRRLTTCSYPEIGALFGGRDHSTVIHANRVIEEKLRCDAALRAEVEEIERKLKGK